MAMTNKSKRQRGTRTHGGGSHKNRRGAGHRGGRGRAGRAKHEHHKYEPLGKQGFSRPEKVQQDVETINVQKLDEDAPLLVAEGLAKQTDEGYVIDARDVVEDGWGADEVKVLGDGQVRNTLKIKADAFSASAAKLIESQGGKAIVSTDNGANSPPEFVSELKSKVEAGEPLTREECKRLLDADLNESAVEVAYEALKGHYEQAEHLTPEEVAQLYRALQLAREYGFDDTMLQNRLDEYFADVDISPEMTSYLTDGLSETIPADEVPQLLDHRHERLRKAGIAAFGREKSETLEEVITETQREYLYLIRDRVVGTA